MRATQQNAITLARLCERVAPQFGFHTALTGGCLYKDGERKDVDILFYPHCGAEVPNKQGLLDALKAEFNFDITGDFGRVVKSKFMGQVVDLFFPGYEGTYPQ